MKPGNSILIIEDDPEFGDYLRRGLSYEGYRVRLSSSSEAGLVEIRLSQPDLLILDVMLPGMDGMATCRSLRQLGYSGPILMLTARNAVDDRVTGLESGADDYLGKPIVFDELLARLRALLRRRDVGGHILSFADLELDSGLRLARRKGSPISLSRTEYDLLALFLNYPRQVLTRDTLLEKVWGTEKGDLNVLDVYISRLRRKLGDPPLIQTIYGVGYLLKVEGA